MSSYQFNREPKKVPGVSTENRLIKTSIPCEGTKEILEELFPNGLVPLCNINALEEKVIKVSDKNYLTPKENIYTSERMINETINLYHQLLSTEL